MAQDIDPPGHSDPSRPAPGEPLQLTGPEARSDGDGTGRGSGFTGFGRLLAGFALETIGVVVFLLSALAIIVVIIVFVPFPNGVISNFEILRSVQLLLTLAGTAVILALIARSKNPAIMIFGFLLIGALIVPTGDLIRFALIATGSEKSYKDFFISPTTTGKKDPSSSDLASRILDRLILVLGSDAIREDARQRAIANIEFVLNEEQRRNLIERIQQRGVLTLLRHLNEDEGKEGLVYRYSQQERFLDDLSFLKAEGLITYMYDDYDDMELTPLGLNVIAFNDFDDVYPMDAVPEESLPAIPDDDEITRLNLRDDKGSYPIGADWTWFSFTTVDDGDYQIDVFGSDDVTDPVAALFQRESDDDRGVFLARDDDSGGGYRSRMVETLDGGERYYLAVRLWSGEAGRVEIRVAPRAQTATRN